jgi:hypothetical protein
LAAEELLAHGPEEALYLALCRPVAHGRMGQCCEPNCDRIFCRIVLVGF